MSIYCSLFEVGGEHKPRCNRVKRIERGVYEVDHSKPCTCGSCPINYQGSHILPSDKDRRWGEIGISGIPPHITRNGRDDKPEDGKWYPWLRVHLHDGFQDSVVLTKKQVEAFRDALNKWLERT